jgi:ribosome-associated toxin RatA of RatAB toxin-antitoxin module
MQLVVQKAVVHAKPKQVYDQLADFSAYPDLAPSVIQVQVEEISPDEEGRRRCRSAWEVNFRKGILRWVEIDVFDYAIARIDFVQESGDMELLVGGWQIHAHESGSVIEFEAQFDLGLPGLATYLEPVAQRALEDNVREVLTRLFPGATMLDPAEVEL